MDKEPGKRLGSNGGIQEVMDHPFFKSIDFKAMVNKELEPPFKPTLSADLTDVSNFDTQFTSEEARNSIIPTSKLQ